MVVTMKYPICYFCGYPATEEGTFYNNGRKIHRCDTCKDLMDKNEELREKRLKKREQRKNNKELKYNPDDDSNLIKLSVNNLPEKWLNNISREFYEREVYLVKNNSRKKAGEILTDYLNERFVRRQLELENPDSDKRETWYIVDTRMSGNMDFEGDTKQQYIIISNAVEKFCSKLIDFFNVSYWGFVFDELSLKSKGKAIIFDMNLTGTLLDVKALKGAIEDGKTIDPHKCIDTPFFFLICEKEAILLNVMKGLKERGYNIGWYGIGTEGYSSTNVIRLLLRFQELKKFYIFVIHDYDVDGIKILLDLKKYFPCESAGLNPIVIDRSGIDLTHFYIKYKSRTGEATKKQLTGAETMINSLELSEEEKEMYHGWIKGCTHRRAELQGLTGHRLSENMELNSARDFIDYIIYLLEETPRIYDLNRYKTPFYYSPDLQEPEITKPSFIDDIRKEIWDKSIGNIIKYLKSKNLETDESWINLFKEKYELMVRTDKILQDLVRRYGKIRKRRYCRKNKRYDESLLGVNKIINHQEDKLWMYHISQNQFLRKVSQRQRQILERLIRRTPEYKEIKDKMEEMRDSIVESLKDIDFGDQNDQD